MSAIPPRADINREKADFGQRMSACLLTVQFTAICASLVRSLEPLVSEIVQQVLCTCFAILAGLFQVQVGDDAIVDDH